MKVALLVLFNHNYEANLAKLDSLYSSKFSNLFYIMPYYGGIRKDVISVFGNPIYFQGYIAIALQQLKYLNFDNYLIIGDDLLLNPLINESNYHEYFRVDSGTGFVPGFFYMNDVNETRPYRPFAPYWENSSSAYDFTTIQSGVDGAKFLPSYDEALLLFKQHGLNFTPHIPEQMFYRKPLLKRPFTSASSYNRMSLSIFKKRLFNGYHKRQQMVYPLIGSYADCVIVPKTSIDTLIKYCGVFAGLRLFVEIGLPTAMALAISKITQEKDLQYNGETYWADAIQKMEDKYDRSLTNLLGSFPSNTLYIHPIKFSRWK